MLLRLIHRDPAAVGVSCKENRSFPSSVFLQNSLSLRGQNFQPMEREIILVTGGQRSGKSDYAQRLALQRAENPVYLATSRVWDDEYRLRIERHKARRGSRWTNLEEEKEISRHDLTGRVVVVDCVTLWATNFFFDNASDVELSLQQLQAEFDRFTSHDATYIFVTNEIGMGGTSEHLTQRRFADLQGGINQYIAAKADRVVFMVSGCPLAVKGSLPPI